MNKYLLLFAAVGLIAVISCSPAQKDSKQQSVQQQNQIPPTILRSDTSAILTSIPATAAANEPAVVNATVTTPKLNPAHGQPFHRCDIAVGSPLDAAPAKPATTVASTLGAPTLENAARLNNPQVNNAQVNNQTAPTVANSSVSGTPPKLNPAHGQPYHRCDIAVGSPLGAAPAKPATTVANTAGAPTLENAARLNNGQVNNAQVNNPTAPTVANASGIPPKLNPPHGQPYHRCDIAVGSPLN